MDIFLGFSLPRSVTGSRVRSIVVSKFHNKRKVVFSIKQDLVNGEQYFCVFSTICMLYLLTHFIGVYKKNGLQREIHLRIATSLPAARLQAA